MRFPRIWPPNSVGLVDALFPFFSSYLTFVKRVLSPAATRILSFARSSSHSSYILRSTRRLCPEFSRLLRSFQHILLKLVRSTNRIPLAPLFALATLVFVIQHWQHFFVTPRVGHSTNGVYVISEDIIRSGRPFAKIRALRQARREKKLVLQEAMDKKRSLQAQLAQMQKERDEVQVEQAKSEADEEERRHGEEQEQAAEARRSRDEALTQSQQADAAVAEHSSRGFLLLNEIKKKLQRIQATFISGVAALQAQIGEESSLTLTLRAQISENKPEMQRLRRLADDKQREYEEAEPTRERHIRAIINMELRIDDLEDEAIERQEPLQIAPVTTEVAFHDFALVMDLRGQLVRVYNDARRRVENLSGQLERSRNLNSELSRELQELLAQEAVYQRRIEAGEPNFFIGARRIAGEALHHIAQMVSLTVATLIPGRSGGP